MSVFWLGILIGAWAGFIFGVVVLSAWVELKQPADDRDPADVEWRRCEACGGRSVNRGAAILHVPGCSQQSQMRESFL